MICDECGIRPATFHITTIIHNGEPTERNLCAACMAKQREKLPGLDFGKLTSFLGNILSDLKSDAEQYGDLSVYDSYACEYCGTTYADVRKSGRLGCANCYKAMRTPLEAMLERRQGSAQHTGKLPGAVRDEVSLKMNIEALRVKLQRAIQAEEYEQAATLRDAIRSLEAKLARESRKEDIRVRPPERIDTERGEGDGWL